MTSIGGDAEDVPGITDDHEEPECNVCVHGQQECGNCDGSGDDGSSWGCLTCGGSGEVVPDHCCACGGSPYCNCCRTCGAECIGDCTCPVTVQRADGSTLTLPGAGLEDPTSRSAASSPRGSTSGGPGE